MESGFREEEVKPEVDDKSDLFWKKITKKKTELNRAIVRRTIGFFSLLLVRIPSPFFFGDRSLKKVFVSEMMFK